MLNGQVCDGCLQGVGRQHAYSNAGHLEVLDERAVTEGTRFHVMQRRVLEHHGEQRVGTEGVATNSAHLSVHKSHLCRRRREGAVWQFGQNDVL